MDAIDRLSLNFVIAARETFAFLNSLGFAEGEACSTLVRYWKEGVEVDVYHGRQSYEIGAGITSFGTRYTMSEIIRASDSEAAKRYRNVIARSPQEVAAGVKDLSSLMQHFGAAALQGDPHFFRMLEENRKRWSEDYALEVLAEQLRPQANQAFRRGEYARAAELYGRISAHLTPAEIQKLAVAERRKQ